MFRPLFWLGKLLLYRPFVRLYYLIFRLRKYELGEMPRKEIIRQKSFHFAAVLLIIAAIVINFADKKPAGAVNAANKSLIAAVVANEFNDFGEMSASEELITDTAPPAKQLQAPSKYLADNSSLTRVQGVNPNTEVDQSPLIASSGSVIKPKEISSNAASTASVSTPSSISSKRSSTITYKVKSGDNISSIASRFGLKVNTVLWANDLTAFSIIKIGQELKILPTDGFIYKVKSGDTIGRLAQVYDVDADKIIASNNLGNSASIRIGEELIIPGNKSAASTSSNRSTSSSYSGLSVIKDIVSSKPVVSNDRMVWPTVGHVITQYYSLKHKAIDIANRIGTPIYAAADGVVQISQGGWNGGYGNTILLDHANNMKTRYGHASKLLVKKGERVKKGQIIALMGSTGHSTGPHLHFEVLVNGVRRNPLNYVR